MPEYCQDGVTAVSFDSLSAHHSSVILPSDFMVSILEASLNSLQKVMHLP
jgi:hypothetical protein